MNEIERDSEEREIKGTCRQHFLGLERLMLTMLTPYPDGRLTGFARARKTSGAAKVCWRRLNLKRSLYVLKWVSESECFAR